MKDKDNKHLCNPTWKQSCSAMKSENQALQNIFKKRNPELCAATRLVD